MVDGQSLTAFAAQAPLPEPSLQALPPALPASQARGTVSGREVAVRCAAELVQALAQAIQAAHAKGIVHGGLNPDNVHLTPSGVPKITNFRRARLPARD